MSAASPIKFSKKYLYIVNPPTPIEYYIQDIAGNVLSNITVRGICFAAGSVLDILGSVNLWSDSSKTNLLYSNSFRYMTPHQQWTPTFDYRTIPTTGATSSGGIYVTTGDMPKYFRGSDGVLRDALVTDTFFYPQEDALGGYSNTLISFMYQEN